jgi:hypothetical protein
MTMDDFLFRNESSIIVLYPKSTAAQKWVSDNISIETWQDPNQISIEPQYFDELVAAIISDGFTISATGPTERPC